MDKKETYTEKIKAQLKKASAKIYQLKGKAERLNLEDGIDYYRQIERVKAMRDLLRLDFQELEEVEEDPGGDLERRVQNSVNDLKETLDIDI